MTSMSNDHSDLAGALVEQIYQQMNDANDAMAKLMAEMDKVRYSNSRPGRARNSGAGSLKSEPCSSSFGKSFCA
jgi:hypothetical protein